MRASKCLGIVFSVAVCVSAGHLLSGCNTSGCLENRNSVPLAGLYSMETKTAITLDSLCITGIGASDGKALVDAGEPISTVYLPMRSTYDSTSWKIAYKWKALDFDELSDTLTFVYDSTPYFASAECGVVYHYRIRQMQYTKHLIDSVAVTDSLVTNLDVERIQIYFRTGNNERP